VVQIDHTPVDLILVDDLHRRPVGRPWITVAINVFSRMIAGFYVSFDPPGAIAVGLCLAHAILPKETWLAKHEIATSRPVWGLMHVVHADNAKEFHSRMLQRACNNYGIHLHWRPVAHPHYGGHIERLLGTFNHDIHALPGTTFSNPAERGTYEAEQKAALTLSEFERWLTIYIMEIYHQRVHRALGTPPIARYTAGSFGTADRPGHGLPDRETFGAYGPSMWLASDHASPAPRSMEGLGVEDRFKLMRFVSWWFGQWLAPFLRRAVEAQRGEAG
jgi:putative transposase